MKKIAGVIYLSTKEREALRYGVQCPNCSGLSFRMYVAEREASKSKPLPALAKGRPIMQCASCGFWADVFDGYVWKPKEMLRE